MSELSFYKKCELIISYKDKYVDISNINIDKFQHLLKDIYFNDFKALLNDMMSIIQHYNMYLMSSKFPSVYVVFLCQYFLTFSLQMKNVQRQFILLSYMIFLFKLLLHSILLFVVFSFIIVPILGIILVFLLFVENLRYNYR